MYDTAHSEVDFLFRPGHLLEAILNADYPVIDCPRKLVLLRVAAAFSNDAGKKEQFLREAADFADSYKRKSWKDAFNWKQVLRCRFELAEFYWRRGRFSQCSAELSTVLEILKKCHYGNSLALADLHRAYAHCMREIGCGLGGQFHEKLAEQIDPGNA